MLESNSHSDLGMQKSVTKLDRTGNAKKNIVYGFISRLVVMLAPFMTRVVIIRVMGSEYLGLDSLFSSILQVLSITELGFSSAVVHSMYKPIAENDYDTLGAILLYFKKVYRMIGMIILGSGFCITPFLHKLIHTDVGGDVNIYVLYAIYLANTAVSYFLFAYRSSLLNAYQREDIVSGINALVKIAVMIMQVVIIFSSRNYYVYTFTIILGSVINNVFAAIVTRRIFPQIRERGKLNKIIRLDIRKKVGGLVIQKVCSTSRNAFDSIFISAFLGLTQVAIYSNYYYVLSAVSSVLAIFTTAITAGVGNTVATENVEKNYADLKRINFLYMMMSGWCTVCLTVLYQPFVEIMFGEEMLYPFGVVMLLCLYFYSLKLGDVRTVYVQGVGLWWENRYRSIVEAVTNIVLNYVLGKFWGVYGIILATWISVFFINFLWGSQIIFVNYFGKDKIKDYFMSHLRYAFVTVLNVIIVCMICSQIKGKVYFRLVMNLMVCVFVGIGFYILVYRRSREFSSSYSLLEGMIKSSRLKNVLKRVYFGMKKTTDK